MVISLIGGIAPRLIEADGNIDLDVKGSGRFAVVFGEPTRKPKTKAETAKESKSAEKVNTKVAVKKGHKAMTTIDSTNSGVGNASSLPGE